jgi:hypothetical protein
MNELMHRDAAKRKAEAAEYEARQRFARALSSDQVSQMERALAAKPEDFSTRETLLIYYRAKKDIQNRDRHLLWLIEHDPKNRSVAIPADPPMHPVAFEKGKRLWLKSLQTADEKAYREAALFTGTGDKPLAERILLEAAKKFPDSRSWSTQLGSLYFQVLVGSQGPLPMGVIRQVSRTATRGPYAQAIRRKLETTPDVELLGATARGLMHSGSNLYWNQVIDFDPLKLAEHYVDRSEQLAPDSRTAKVLRFSIDRGYPSRRVQELVRGRDRHEDLLAKATDEDRWYLLPMAMDGAFHRDDLTVTDTYAREYLALGTKNPSDRRYGRAIFDANMQLGKIHMRRGDTGQAGKYLMASLSMPGSDAMKYVQFDMTLARTLVDAGQRDIVAQCLDRCARITVDGDRYKQWADEIRKGINPDLIPYRTGCAKEPC